MEEVENTNPHQNGGLPPVALKHSILKPTGKQGGSLLGAAGPRKVATSQHVRARTGITHQNS
jgi:hypothetical protein